MVIFSWSVICHTLEAYRRQTDMTNGRRRQGQNIIINMPIGFHFRSKINFRKNFIAQKVSSWNFRGSLLSYFWAITFISAVIAILDPFGTLVPRISATVKVYGENQSFKLLDITWHLTFISLNPMFSQLSSTFVFMAHVIISTWTHPV